MSKITDIETIGLELRNAVRLLQLHGGYIKREEWVHEESNIYLTANGKSLENHNGVKYIPSVSEIVAVDWVHIKA